MPMPTFIHVRDSEHGHTWINPHMIACVEAVYDGPGVRPIAALAVTLTVAGEDGSAKELTIRHPDGMRELLSHLGAKGVSAAQLPRGK